MYKSSSNNSIRKKSDQGKSTGIENLILNHDLMNPISSIKLAAQLLQQKDNLSPEFIKKIGGNILDAVELLIDMVKQESKTS